MGILIRKEKGVRKFTGIAKLSFLSLIVSFAFAMVETVWAIYMNGFLGSEAFVGLFSAILTLTAFISYFIFIPVIERSNKAQLYGLTLLLTAITFILFAINRSFYFFILLAFVLIILYTFRITSFGIIVKDKSNMKRLASNEGLIYTFANTSWVIGPLVAGFMSERYGINLIFSLSATFLLISFLMFRLFKIRDAHIKKKVDKNLIKNFVDFFKKKDRVIAYILGGGVNMWWILLYLFIPLYILRQGLGAPMVGYFLFAVAVPLIIFQYYFSSLASKKGFKKIFRVGYLIPCICVLTCFFVANAYIVLGLLIAASIGLSMLEATTEAYFFHTIKRHEESRFYGPYNTAVDTGSLVGKVSSTLVLFFLPFKFLFLLYSVLMFAVFVLTFFTRDVIEDKK
jgi:MFS family permease